MPEATKSQRGKQSAQKDGRRPRGRPLAATNEEGQPEATAGWAQVSCRLRPSTKAALEALQSIDRRPLWQLFESLLLAHIRSLPADDRKLIELLAKRQLTTPPPARQKRP